ncbi:hypothetical protein APTSU1_000080600 [Apodemus speciosus]|uniref:Uncharacterized protein n=1 Tax=Apodemus speciosus TaxID=105296 RepID=A0ABQ0EF68_APOSI
MGHELAPFDYHFSACKCEVSNFSLQTDNYLTPG